MARSKVPDGWEHIHRILGATLRLVQPVVWPAGWPDRAHLGGPPPELDTRHQLRVGLRLVDTVAPSVLARPAFEQLFDLATRAHADERIEHATLDTATALVKNEEAPLRFAKLVARAGKNYLYSPGSARDSIGAAIEAAVGVLVTERSVVDVDGVAGLLERIDAELCRGELEQLLELRAIVPVAPVARVVARPVDGVTKAGKRLGCIAARLEGGRWGLYVKLKSRWQWHDGDRASVFATVPDAFMDAVGAALG